MRDFKPNLLFNLGGHAMNLPENKTIDNAASRRRIETEGGPVGRYAQRWLDFERKFSHLVIRLAAVLCVAPYHPGGCVFRNPAPLSPSPLFLKAPDYSLGLIVALDRRSAFSRHSLCSRSPSTNKKGLRDL